MKKRKIFDKLLNNKQFMILFSLAAAVLTWFVVVAQISPNSTRVIYNVPITINEKSGFLFAAGLHVIEESRSQISVEVSGPRYVIGRLGPSDFLVTPDTGKVDKSGEFTLKLVPQMKNPKTDVSIIKISQKAITVRFDTLASKSIPIEVKISGNSRVANGYIMETASVSPQKVVVTGPSSEVNQIARAVTNVEIKSSDTTTVSDSSNIAFYDSKNNKLTLKHIKTDYNQAIVTVPILKTKQVPLLVDFFNLPTGFDEHNIKYTINPSNITVAGNQDDIATLASMKLDNIDFSTLDLTNSISDSIIAQRGITNVDSVDTVTVTINLLNTGTKTLSTKDIKIVNLPSGYSARVRTKQIDNVKVFGPSSDIGGLTSVTATVDLTDQTTQGTYQVPATISVPGKSGYWVTGTYMVTVNVWKN